MAEREKLLQFRQGTRGELNASTGNWKPGEPGYITDEGIFIIATLDAPANQNVFVEYAAATTVQKSIISRMGTVDPSQGALAFNMYDNDDVSVSFWYKHYATGKFDYVVPNIALVGKIKANVMHFLAARCDAELFIDSFPNLTEISHEASSVIFFESVKITGNPKLTQVIMPGNGAFAGKTFLECWIWDNPILETIDLNGNVDLTTVRLGVTVSNLEAPTSLTSINLSGCTSIDGDDSDFQTLVDDLPTHPNPGDGSFAVTGATGITGATNWTGGTNLKSQIEAKNWTVTDS